MHNPMDLSGRRILITGASSGIGKATAELCARLGASVTGVARGEERLKAVINSLPGAGHAAITRDLENVEGIPAWIKDLAGQSGPFHGLVHCAGFVQSRPLQILGTTDVQRTFDINFNAALFLAKGFRQKGVCHSGASLVLMSSVAALRGQPAMAAYSAAKGALISLTRTLALELLRDKLRVNCICGGIVNTEQAIGLQAHMGADNLQKVMAEHPLGMGSPEDVANAIAFLLGACSRWITGTTMIVDGGYLA
jgi:NAD(P)-dependent dehydrogenase (short-subunit alcohol dehydrogenase family)